MAEVAKSLLVLDPPRLVIVTGVGASGKTSLINGLAQPGLQRQNGLMDFINIRVIEKDKIGDLQTKSRGKDYEATIREGIYQMIPIMAERWLKEGVTVAIDASFRSQNRRLGWEQAYRDLALKYDALLKIIRLTARPDILQKRIIVRDSEHDQYKPFSNLTALTAYHETEEPIEVPMPAGSLILPNEGSYTLLVNLALDYIKHPSSV